MGQCSAKRVASSDLMISDVVTGSVSLHDPTSHKKNTSRLTSLVGRVAVLEVAAVAGAVRRGRRVTSSPMMSLLCGSRLWLVDSVSLLPAVVTVSQPPVPPVSEPVRGVGPLTDEAPNSVW